MQLYLSSFRIGNQATKLKAFASGKRIGFIPNALDYVEAEARAKSNAKSIQEVRDLGIDVESLDLKEYFGARTELEAKIGSLGGVWIRGGNTFVLRQAMRLSGFDALITDLASADFLYGGYSAGACVLASSLDGLQHVDDPRGLRV
jgi:dipeptidase E